MPVTLVDALPKLADLADDAPGSFLLPPTASEGRAPGQTYNRASIAVPPIARDPFSVDPAAVERGLQSHSKLQNLLADHLAHAGLEPRSPGPLDPAWDLLWDDGDTVRVAEVKSLTRSNEERQLRLGLGQILIYRQRLLASHPSVQAVLMVEWKPLDPEWHALCDKLDVLLLWPGAISAKLPQGD